MSEKFDFTKEHLAQILKGNQYVDYWYDALEMILPDYEIDTLPRVAAFLAQTVHESGGYKFLKENLNYRATSLRRVFPKYFPTDEKALLHVLKGKNFELYTFDEYNKSLKNIPHKQV